MTDKDFDACIAWIAENDESAETNWRNMQYLVSVCMVADLSGENNEYVAKRVIDYRTANQRKLGIYG